MTSQNKKHSGIYLTFDIEPFWTAIPVEHSREMWDISDNSTDYWTNKFLDFCIQNNFGSHFFVVGRWAENNHQLIKKIHSSGFSIGSHSYWHEDLSKLNKEDFIADVVRSKKLLEDITGEEVYTFRAPSFSILPDQLTILEDVGYTVDSSTTDAWRLYGGQSSFNDSQKIRLVTFNGMRVAGKNFPVLGGGYMRALPESFFRLSASLSLGNMIYLHPVDLPSQLSNIPYLSIKQNFRKRLRLGSTFKKLTILSKNNEMVSLKCK